MEREAGTLEEFEAAARSFAGSLAPRGSGATLVTLSGELGTGKTTFVQALAKALGITDAVTSPTFVLEKVYALPEGARFKRLVHIDAYRLGGADELPALGFDELMQDAKSLIVMEWPERVAPLLRGVAHALTLTVREDGTRAISHA